VISEKIIKRGRPIATKTLVTQMVRTHLVQRIAEEFDPIVDSLIQAAIGGILITRTNSSGRKTVSITKPDVSAARLLFEYAIGKPKETIEHHGGTGIVALIAELNGRDNN
jgi:hypothetical protein